MFKFSCFLVLICFAASVLSINASKPTSISPKFYTTSKQPILEPSNNNINKNITLECSKFQNSSLMISTDLRDFNASVIDITKSMPSETVNCTNQCLAFICHNGENITYGGGCIEDFDEMCKDRVYYNQIPQKSETCSKVQDSFVSFQCTENYCNEISKQTNGLMKCMVNTVVESWNFLMGGNLFNFIPLNQRPKHEDFDPFINTSSSITPDITTIPSVKATTNIDKSVTDSGAEITSTIVVEKTSESNGAASKNTEFKMFSMVLTGIFINYYYY